MNTTPPAPATEASLLAGLNEQQRQAALQLVGPVAVLAGAGTGKTRTITHRIAYGLHTGVYEPGNVLALTFTAKAAGELRGRLRELGAPTVQARTFHSAALRQLGHFWPHTVGGPAPAILNNKGALIAQAGERIRLKLDPATVRDVAGEIEWRKVSERSLNEYRAALGHERPLLNGLSADQLVDLMQAYEDTKDERRQIDFEDVLLATAGMLELEPWVAHTLRQQYRYFVVDEYQDVSPLQQRLIDLWLGDRNNLCVVGDPAQMIYSFTGANSHYLTGFSDRFPGARIIELQANYRSTPPILEVANAISRQIPHSIELFAADPDANRHRHVLPIVHEEHDDTSEAEHIADAIARELALGTPAEEIAVLTRVNAQAEAITQALARRDIPMRLPGQRPFFDEPAVRQAMTAIRSQALVDTNTKPLFQIVSDILRDAGWTQEPPAREGALRDRWMLWNRLLQLAEEQPTGTTLAAFASQLGERARLQFEPTMPTVSLLTVHTAKGLEWEIVYLAGCVEGLMPISYAQTPAEIEEERRLFYVAVTRAKRRLELFVPRHSSGRERRQETSRFIGELGPRVRTSLYVPDQQRHLPEEPQDAGPSAASA